jgi:hypothetical protein
MVILKCIIFRVRTSKFLLKLSKTTLFAFAEGALPVTYASVFVGRSKAENTMSLERKSERLTLSGSGFCVAPFAMPFSADRCRGRVNSGLLHGQELQPHSSTQGLTVTSVRRERESPRHVH